MRTDKSTIGNTGLASGGVIPMLLLVDRDRLCKLVALCFYSSSVQVDPARAGLRNPPERQAPKRYS